MIGILLIQLGTPASPSVPDVRRYLREFLMDPRVINLPAPFRWMLVNLIIAPFRSPKSAHAYQSIWTSRGSPLRFHTEDLARGIQSHCGSDYVVRYAMRYGQPSIEDALDELLRLCPKKVLIVPLYPQFAEATTQSCWDEVDRYVSQHLQLPEIRRLEFFYSDPNYLDAVAASVDQDVLKSCDHILFSYHGLPESQIRQTDSSGHCLTQPNCCEVKSSAHLRCYRAQCFQTTEAVRAKLQLPASKVTTSFQSRLGRAHWIKPYTEDVLQDLARSRGVKRLGVLCPSFVADCLETLEEIGLRGRETFIAAGGEDLILIPNLNASSAWIEGLGRICLQKTS